MPAVLLYMIIISRTVAPVIFNSNIAFMVKMGKNARIALAKKTALLKLCRPDGQPTIANTYRNKEFSMKKIFYFIIALLLTTATETLAAPRFIDGFEDVPLMDGLRQETNQDFSFGNEESGYTETLLIAQKNQTYNDIKLFYKDILQNAALLHYLNLKDNQ